MKSVKEQAEHYRLCLALSFVTIGEVVAWADTVILNSADISRQVIDLALAGNRYKDEVMDCLSAIQGSCDYETIAVTVFQEVQEGYRNIEPGRCDKGNQSILRKCEASTQQQGVRLPLSDRSLVP